MLAEAFYLTGDIERYGTGFIRIREVLRAYPEIGFEVSEVGDYFLASLKITPPMNGNGEFTLTALEQKILLCVLENPALSSADIAAQIGMRRDTVKEYLARIKRKGFIYREGSLRAGFWRVTESGKLAVEENVF